MNRTSIFLSSAVAVFAALLALSALAGAATAMQVGASGRTYASSAVQCATNPATGVPSPVVEAGLLNPKKSVSAGVSLNGTAVATVTAANRPLMSGSPMATTLWLW